MTLLADCGNSCCKLAPADNTAAICYLAYDAEDFSTQLQDYASDHRELVYTFGNAQGAEHLLAAWPHEAQRIGTDLPLPDCGQYEGMGQDRILAGLAAVHLLQSDVIVVDAGTALTVDAWRFDQQPPSRCRFDGGCIAPGPEAMLAGLQSLAPALRLPLIPSQRAPFPAHGTAGSILAGCSEGFRSCCQGLAKRLQEQSGIADVLCCGGWMDEELCLAISGNNSPHSDLVLQGMRIALGPALN